MSARRRYTIECDGPGCISRHITDKGRVGPAREVAASFGWWKLGPPRERAVDFCTRECEEAYDAAEAERHG